MRKNIKAGLLTLAVLALIVGFGIVGIKNPDLFVIILIGMAAILITYGIFLIIRENIK